MAEQGPALAPWLCVPFFRTVCLFALFQKARLPARGNKIVSAICSALSGAAACGATLIVLALYHTAVTKMVTIIKNVQKQKVSKQNLNTIFIQFVQNIDALLKKKNKRVWLRVGQTPAIIIAIRL